QHVLELLQIVQGRERPVSGDDLHIRRKHGDDLRNVGDQALYTAAAVQVDEREHAGEEVISHVHHVRLWEEDDDVAVGMALGEVDGADVLAIDMNLELVVKGDDGQRGFGRGRDFHLQ